MELALGLGRASRALTTTTTVSIATAVPCPVMFSEHLILGQLSQSAPGLVDPYVHR